MVAANKHVNGFNPSDALALKVILSLNKSVFFFKNFKYVLEQPEIVHWDWSQT